MSFELPPLEQAIQVYENVIAHQPVSQEALTMSIFVTSQVATRLRLNNQITEHEYAVAMFGVMSKACKLEVEPPFEPDTKARMVEIKAMHADAAIDSMPKSN